MNESNYRSNLFVIIWLKIIMSVEYSPSVVAHRCESILNTLIISATAAAECYSK